MGQGEKCHFWGALGASSFDRLRMSGRERGKKGTGDHKGRPYE